MFNRMISIRVIVALLVSAMAASAPVPGGTTRAESTAANALVAQLAAMDSVLYVYKDFADGANNFTQKAWMGSSDSNVPEMDEAAEGVSGITGIRAEIDLKKHTWGGYLFVNGVLPAGKTNPESDFGNVGAGFDLTGAKKLVFSARGERGGERVEFFAGGLGWDERLGPTAKFADTAKVSLGYITLGASWRQYEIPLVGKNLSSIGSGFGWVTNNTNNPGVGALSFYMDDIRYEFEKPSPKPMFLQSYAAVRPDNDDYIINNFGYLYDSSGAAIVMSYAGKHERARQIADAIVYCTENDRYFPAGHLRNAYSGGAVESFPNWYSGKGKAFARLPGFYDQKDKKWYEDYYSVSTSTGNLAWALLALIEVGRNAPEPERYMRAAKEIADFILTLKSDTGGFTGGFEGWEGKDLISVTYKSTEHNLDLIAAYRKLADWTGIKSYRAASEHAKAFVLSMYDAKLGCFYTGTASDGVTINKSVLPLDCNTWAILALGDDFPDYAKTLNFIEENMAVGGGYDFDQNKDGVWFEGTAQAALAYKQAGNEAKYREILAFMNANANPDGTITASDRDGVSTGFNVSGLDMAWEYGKRTHVGATMWLAFAQLGVNPFE
ncbi:MAG: hypothetical protein LBN99_07960 [Oscillospiraceae bacterium]|jgi:hypothetical protein|nr:hypothetical protein [Oscillospiraceae bacterium]